MRITIAERLIPFCHQPGTLAVLPGSGHLVQIFPCLIRIYELNRALPVQMADLSLALKGPVDQFTFFNDLEKGRITVSGMTSEGWIRYHLISSQDAKTIRLLIDRSPPGGVRVSGKEGGVRLIDKEWLDLLEATSSFVPYQAPVCDRLSLGCHKAQDWELIHRRLGLEEILPHWHRLGQLIPQHKFPLIPEGTLLLLEECKRHFAYGNPEEAVKSWMKCFLGGFSGLLAPRLEDSDYQGLVPHQPISSLDLSPLILLSEGARLIRQLFILQEKGILSILPLLLPNLPFGRLIDVPLEGGGAVSLEWSKKTIRKVIIESHQEGEIGLKFRSNVRSCRLRRHQKEAGERRNCTASLVLKKDCRYILDNFN